MERAFYSWIECGVELFKRKKIRLFANWPIEMHKNYGIEKLAKFQSDSRPGRAQTGDT
jgi:hypothetical protein